MPKKNPTTKLIHEQLAEYGIEFGERYRDPASEFEGVVVAFYFFEHGCLRVNLRGQNNSTGGALEMTFDAPELVRVADDKPVPKGSTKGGPHGLTPMSRPGPA
jgi:hypothetical protein